MTSSQTPAAHIDLHEDLTLLGVLGQVADPETPAGCVTRWPECWQSRSARSWPVPARSWRSGSGDAT